MELIERVNTKDIKYLKSLSLKDLVDAGALNKCKTKKEQKEQFDKINGYLTRMDKVGGEMKHIYKHTLLTNMEMGGRLFSGTSVQAVSCLIRGMLFGKTTTDLDCANCHPKILRWVCKKNSILCPNLDYYCNNREEVLNTGDDRNANKIAILKMVNDDKVNRGLRGFLKDLDKECKNLQKSVTEIEEYKELLNTIPEHKIYNWYGSAINRILCKYENLIIQEVLHICNTKNIEVCALMFDGLMIYGDYYNDKELITEVEAKIEEKFKGLNMKMTYKKHDETLKIPDDWVEPTKKDLNEPHEAYLLWKTEFEKLHTKIINTSNYFKKKFIINENGEEEFVGHTVFNKANLITAYEHLSYKKNISDGPNPVYRKTKYIMEWLNDETMSYKESTNIIPKPKFCPDTVYNLWKLSKYDGKEIKKEDEKYNDEAVQAWLDHIKIMADHNDEVYTYIISWFAHMLQKPYEKPGVSIMVTGLQGTGKTIALDPIKKIMAGGYFETSNPERDVWGTFNPLMADSLLVILSEIDKSNSFKATGKIKALKTDTEITIRNLGCAPYVIDSYTRFWGFSNNPDPVDLEEQQRRDLIIKMSPEKKGDKPYFDAYAKHWENPDNLLSLYSYLMSYDISKWKFREFPKAKYQNILEEFNQKPIDRFFEWWVTKNALSNNDYISYYGNQLYADFNIWREEHGGKFEVNGSADLMKKIVLTLNLPENALEKGQRTKTGQPRIFNMKLLKKHYKINECLLSMPQNENTDIESETD